MVLGRVAHHDDPRGRVGRAIIIQGMHACWGDIPCGVGRKVGVSPKVGVMVVKRTSST